MAIQLLGGPPSKNRWKKWAQGTTASSGTVVTVPGLKFTPRVIVLRDQAANSSNYGFTMAKDNLEFYGLAINSGIDVTGIKPTWHANVSPFGSFSVDVPGAGTYIWEAFGD